MPPGGPVCQVLEDAHASRFETSSGGSHRRRDRCPADGPAEDRHSRRRIVITRDGSTEEQTLGDQTSYTYQLATLADTLQTGTEFMIDVDDSVANAELIDEVYRRAGLSPRG
jgi:hypothetical protein